MKLRILVVLLVLIGCLAWVRPSFAAPEQASLDRDRRFESYLATRFVADVSEVRVTADAVKISGSTSAADAVLVEVPLWADPTDLRDPATTVPIKPDAAGRFAATVERQTTLDGRPHDRLLSRWAIAKKTSTVWQLLSAAKWCENPDPPAKVPAPLKPKSKKGVGGLHGGRPMADLDDLAIGAVTVNIPLTMFMRDGAAAGTSAFRFGGRDWRVSDRAVAGLDRTMTEAAKRNILVSAIILIPPARNAAAGSFAQRVAHPNCDASATYAMPNLDSRDGAEAYAAAMAFLTERYGQADAPHGRIHHYILHNEIDMGWVWTNAGEQPMRVYLELYHRSMRVAHLLARRFDPNAKAFISLTHHWSKAGGKRNFPSRDLLNVLLDWCRVEGDFEWAIAHHPYPQDLRNPRVWADNQPTFSFDTPKITLRNIEVLDAWVRQPRVMYKGKTVRTIHLSEQGLNARDYSEKSLTEQAAGLAYAWRKIRDLRTIEAFQYHGWDDHRQEGGLRIGLRKFPDEATDPHGKKPIFHLYQAIGTPREAEAMKPYLPVTGLKSWDEAPHHGDIR